MGEFAGNISGAQENPVVTASQGEFFVATEPEERRGFLSMKVLVLGILSVVMLLALAEAVTHWMWADRSAPPAFVEMKSMIGQSVSEVQLTAEEGVYSGVPVELDLILQGDLVSGFTYSCRGDPEQVCKDLYSVSSLLLGRYGEEHSFTHSALLETENRKILRLLKAQAPYSTTWTWDLTESEIVDRETLVAREDWPGSVSGDLSDHGGFYLDLSVSSDEPGMALMELRYSVGTTRE